MANYVFKQFCEELDAGSLDHLIDIVGQPAAKSDLLSDEEDDSDDEDDDSDVELAEQEDIGDDDDSDDQ